MQSTLNSGGDAPSPSGSEEIWAQLAPLLDDAMNQLGETDRAALVLRYFQNKTAREIAVALRMEEEAAQKRVARALEKLRRLFAKRGVDSTADAITGAISANSIQIAPAGLGGSGDGSGERSGGGQFNLNPCERSIENYGMDKSENGGGYRDGFNSGSRNDGNGG